jgi:hypothetical protein
VTFREGQTITNLVIVKPSGSGTLCVYTSTTTHVVIDVNGYYRAGSAG